MTDTFNAVVFGLIATVAIGACLQANWAKQLINEETREGNER